MIIIPREELNRAASGLNQPRGQGLSFDKWMPAASGKKIAEPATTEQSASAPSLYRNRLWRCE